MIAKYVTMFTGGHSVMADCVMLFFLVPTKVNDKRTPEPERVAVAGWLLLLLLVTAVLGSDNCLS